MSQWIWCIVLGLIFSGTLPARLVFGFSLSECASKAIDIVEVAPVGNGRFRVVNVWKGSTPVGPVRVFPELAGPRTGKFMREIVEAQHPAEQDLKPQRLFDRNRYYQSAPPLRDGDRLIVFLGRDGGPVNGRLLLSTIWLQAGTAYAFEGKPGLGIEHFDYCQTPSFGSRAEPNNEGLVRKDLANALGGKPVRRH